MSIPFYMSADEALEEGFTHHGRMFSVEVWVADVDHDIPMVAAKFEPAEAWITLCTIVVQMLSIFTGVGFSILIGDPIEADDDA
jgi:hypothetical protein